MSGTGGTSLTRLLYVDDSGSAANGGLVVYGWVEVHPRHWSSVLGRWLELRRSLVRDYGIPVSRELHGTEFVNGRGKIAKTPPARLIATDPDGRSVTLWKELGREAAERCLALLGQSEEVRVGAVHCWAGGDPKAWGRAKYDTYGAFVHEVDAALRAEDALGLIVMDGDDPHYRAAHRALPLSDRRVLEDPVGQDSRISQWTQMADLVAYTAHLSLNRHEGNRFGWDWYSDHLGQRDPRGGPQELPHKTARPA